MHHPESFFILIQGSVSVTKIFSIARPHYPSLLTLLGYITLEPVLNPILCYKWIGQEQRNQSVNKVRTCESSRKVTCYIAVWRTLLKRLVENKVEWKL
jgi:hypothetical protein